MTHTAWFWSSSVCPALNQPAIEIDQAAGHVGAMVHGHQGGPQLRSSDGGLVRVFSLPLRQIHQATAICLNYLAPDRTGRRSRGPATPPSDAA